MLLYLELSLKRRMNAALCVNHAHTLGDYFLFFKAFGFKSKKVEEEKVAFAMSVESEVEPTTFQSWLWLKGPAGESLATEVPVSPYQVMQLIKWPQQLLTMAPVSLRHLRNVPLTQLHLSLLCFVNTDFHTAIFFFKLPIISVFIWCKRTKPDLTKTSTFALTVAEFLQVARLLLACKKLTPRGEMTQNVISFKKKIMLQLSTRTPPQKHTRRALRARRDSTEYNPALNSSFP